MARGSGAGDPRLLGCAGAPNRRLDVRPRPGDLAHHRSGRRAAVRDRTRGGWRGSVNALRAALLATGPGGQVENLGFHFADVSLPLTAMHFKCLTFRSALSNARPLIPEVLALVASGRISPQRVQTAVLPFDEAAEALPTAGFKPVFVRDPINLE